MSIKKSFTEVVKFLEANQNKKVSTILAEVYVMTSSKVQQATYLLDSDDNVFAIFCYYHKQWELVKDVPYGSKANTVTKLNTMCKVGVSKWTKAQRNAKSQLTELIDQLADGSVQPSDIKGIKEDIEATRLTIDDTDQPFGFSSLLEVTNHLTS